MYSSSRFNQAVLLQMPGVSVDLLKAPPVLTGIGAWCSLPPRAKNDDRALPYGNWLLRVLCAHKHVESRFNFPAQCRSLLVHAAPHGLTASLMLNGKDCLVQLHSGRLLLCVANQCNKSKQRRHNN